MRNNLILLIFLLIICGSCCKSPVEDTSLTLQEFQKMGIPNIDKNWNLDDYSSAFGALKTLKLNKPFVLPVKDSNKSGALFNHMVSFENMSFLNDESIPLNEKAHMIMGFLEVHEELIDIYTNIRMKNQYYHRELIDINIFGLNLAEKILVLGQKINESKDTKDMNMQSGYKSIQMIYLSELINVLEAQKHTSQYLNRNLEVLTDSILKSVMRNRNWMDNTTIIDLTQALNIVMDSTSSDYIKNKYSMLIEEF